MRPRQELVLELPNSHWESRRVKHDLAIGVEEAYKFLNDNLEFWRKQLVRLQHSKLGSYSVYTTVKIQGALI